ncbi:MAG TPA: two-component regulator propeller domain-containing protein [Chryseosolibacter sp.]
MKPGLAFIAAYFCSFALCCGQDFTTINYSVAEGLPSSEVYEVFEDSRGFLWFGTDNGVVRFDGFELEKFNIDKGLTDPVVFGFLEDKKGRIWFRTFSGRLCYFSKGSIYPYPYNDKLVTILPLGEIGFTYNSDREELHFTIENLLGKIDSTGSVSYEAMGQEGIHINMVGTTPMQRITARFDGRINQVTIDSKLFKVKDDDPKTFHRQTRLLKTDDGIYFTVKKKIYLYDGDDVNLVYDGPGVIISLSEDKAGNIWVGYLYKGVQRFEGGDFSKMWAPDFLKTKSVTRVLEDREHNLWISTLENGVYNIPNLEIKNTRIATQGRMRMIVPIRESFLVGDEAGHLYQYDPATRKLEEKKNFGSPILCGLVDSRNHIWISSVDEIAVFDSLLNRIGGTIEYSCVDFCEDENGVVWGYGNHSMKSFDAVGNLLTRDFFNLRYRQFFRDGEHVFLAGRIGLAIRDSTLNLMQAPDVFSNMKISDIVPLNDTTLLITTLGSGFVVFNKNTWETKIFNARSNFIADNVYGVSKQGEVFWMATEKGIATTTLHELLTPHPGFQYLTKKSGLISNKINFLLAKQSAILAFSDEGLSEIPLPVKRFGNSDPKFYIKEIQINQRSTSAERLASLQHIENNIAIVFGYLSFNNQNIFTRYRLSDEEKWNQSTSNEIQFNALAPGSYKLLLEYSVDNVHWTSASGIPLIVIAPPWWQLWYVKGLLGVIIVILIYLYIRYQIRVYRSHQLKLIQSELEAIEQERKRIAKDLHDSVGTDFSVIKMMVSQLLKKHNEPKSEEIETQFQSTIQDIKTIIYGLSPPGLERYGLMAALTNYIEKLNGSIVPQVHLKTFGAEVKDAKVTVAIFRIIQELISNSLKHSNASVIRLHISSFEDLISIVYEDNGKGFAWDGQSKGLGLYNIESRLKSLNGRLRFDSGSFGVSYTIDIPVEIHSA